ncbi:hypothetical protein A0O34_00455 [Chryseobacterium glaciei]|uniref:Uncharacterized protein n=1 Tax=Chryseobacterium glaciei TaxID=1685010 RepID=A0A172XQ19_9FLAO|nr:hypothetical protein [Chryseobacterium glaciei]ANF49117.1 hypothetical protein A0O34_00455 [Chryseobacterium glaciei]
MNIDNYQNLKGKNKTQIVDELGEEFNFFPADMWTYTLGKSWFGQKKILVILFENDTAVKLYTKRTYGKFSSSNL